MEDGVIVVTHLTQAKEVLAGARGEVTVKFNVEVAQGSVQPQVACVMMRCTTAKQLKQSIQPQQQQQQTTR